MSNISGPWNRLNAKQKAALAVAVIAIIVTIASIEGRQRGLELTNPGLTVPPVATSTTTTSAPPATMTAPITISSSSSTTVTTAR